MQWHRVFFLTFLLSVFPSLTWSDYTVHGILQARNLKWVTIPFPGDLPNPGIKTRSPTLQVDSLPAEPPGKPKNTGVVTYPFSRESSWPRNQTRVSCIAGGFFTSWATRESLSHMRICNCQLHQFVYFSLFHNILKKSFQNNYPVPLSNSK